MARGNVLSSIWTQTTTSDKQQSKKQVTACNLRRNHGYIGFQTGFRYATAFLQENLHHKSRPVNHDINPNWKQLYKTKHVHLQNILTNLYLTELSLQGFIHFKKRQTVNFVLGVELTDIMVAYKICL